MTWPIKYHQYFFFKKNKNHQTSKIRTAPKKVGDFTVKLKIKAWFMRMKSLNPLLGSWLELRGSM
jgi:hypothetical protein